MAGIDPMELFALWMFTHDQADDLMMQSVARGEAVSGEGMSGGPDAFTDGFMAMVSEEKERLMAEIAAGPLAGPEPEDEKYTELTFAVGELRGRMDQMQATLDAIAVKLGAGGK